MKQRDTEKNVIRSARKKFLAMAGTYCLGVFNDNFFKQAVLLIAVSAGLVHLQGKATVLFALPFILFSSYAGWLADRFPKKNVVIGSKALEVLAMATGAAGLLTGNWTCILAMVFLMGAQSAFFSPALNGAIPELYPASHVPKANAVLKLATTLAILAGIALSGVALDQSWFDTQQLPFGHFLVAATVVVTAITGFLTSFGVFSEKATSVKIPFPWFGPLHSLKDLSGICKDRQLFIAIAADSFFYFLASLVVLTINVLGLEQLGLSQTATSMLSMSLMIGICFGSLLAARIMSMRNWSHHLVSSAFLMGAGLFMCGYITEITEYVHMWMVAALVAATGTAGGLFLIPVTSFLQVRPEASTKGRVLAAANFCGFIGILLSGMLFNQLHDHFSPSSIMEILAVFSFVFGCFFFIATKASKHESGRPFIALFLKMLLSIRYRLTVQGLDDLQIDADKPLIFLPNHPALIDPVIVMSILYRKFQPRPLSDTDQVNKPAIRQIMKLVRPITLPDLHKNGRSGSEKVREALIKVVDSLNNGEQIILYPSGRIFRSNKEQLSANSAVETVIKNVPDVQVVLVRTSGLWGSSFSRANEKEPSLVKYIKKYCMSVLSGGIFFMPKRNVTIEFKKDQVVTSLSGRRTINTHLENFYNAKPIRNTTVPYFWWNGRHHEILPEPVTDAFQGNLGNISTNLQNQVLEKLEQITGQKVIPGKHLANDLAMDSLTLMEFITWLENEFGIAVDDSSRFQSVDDCILAAGGQLAGGSDPDVSKISKGWFENKRQLSKFEKKSTITDSYLAQFSKNPRRILFSDQLSGCKSNREIVSAIYVMKPLIEKMSGKNVGIMLPASVSASITYLATLFSGKTPVMYNWTSGIANMKHGIEVTDTKTIITARKLYERIQEQQSVDLATLPVNWFFLDDFGAQLHFITKLTAFLKACFLWRSLKKIKVSETAAILFTSGSESKPKAVPLTHSNILANMEDFAGLITVSSREKLLGMLPPFHSLGLVGTIILPLITGLRTVYHANPTESVTLAKLIAAYKTTMTIGTPTFIGSILQVGSKEQLESLMLIFTGAEKCPQHVSSQIKEVLPGAVLCEGYGITECSPLVSINSPAAVKEGSIGRVLPSIEYVIIDPETGKAVKPGDQGVLLVRGASIFNGYLNDETGKGFRRFSGKIWYDTGDFVRENDDATLSFCGRQKRFVKLAGEMISLPAIENVLSEQHRKDNIGNEGGPLLAVESTGAEGHPELVLFSTFNTEREAINSILRNAGLSPLHNIRRVEKLDEIPLLGSGKTDYQQLKKLLVN